MSRRRRQLLIGTAAALAACATPAPEAPRVHGADNVFADADVAIVWAVLKDDAAGTAQVWLRVVNRSGAFTHAAIDGVDPFSRTRRRVASALVLAPEVLSSSDRATFEELPSREIHFYRSPADARGDRPGLTVYYLGVPDTTPEFTARLAMEGYTRSAPLRSH